MSEYIVRETAYPGAVKQEVVGEIVRCKDCRYAHMSTDGSVKYCEVWFPDEAEYLDGDNYCSCGERKTAESE